MNPANETDKEDELFPKGSMDVPIEGVEEFQNIRIVEESFWKELW